MSIFSLASLPTSIELVSKLRVWTQSIEYGNPPQTCNLCKKKGHNSSWCPSKQVEKRLNNLQGGKGNSLEGEVVVSLGKETPSKLRGVQTSNAFLGLVKDLKEASASDSLYHKVMAIVGLILVTKKVLITFMEDDQMVDYFLNDVEGILNVLTYEDKGLILEDDYSGEKEMVSQTPNLDMSFRGVIFEAFERVIET